MTQPTYPCRTFDTFVDGSTANKQHSMRPLESRTQETAQPTGQGQLHSGPVGLPPSIRMSTPIQYLPTQHTYDRWAAVYDTDGNMLVSIDNHELSNLFPQFCTKVQGATISNTVQLLDLGCGTGRNTMKLLLHPWTHSQNVSVLGLDFSDNMLDVARQKLLPRASSPPTPSLRLEQADCFPTMTSPDASPLPPISNLPGMNGVISTLVLEHVPLNAYFATLSSLLNSNGYALVTNMHSEMGRLSQAGFISEDGTKIRGQSYAHTPQETIQAAEASGFEVVTWKERKMEKDDVDSGRVSARGGKWIGVYVWYGMLLRKW